MKTKALALPKLSKKAKRNMTLFAGAGIAGLGGFDLIKLAVNGDLRDRVRASGDSLQVRLFADVIAMMVGTILLIG